MKTDKLPFSRPVYKHKLKSANPKSNFVTKIYIFRASEQSFTQRKALHPQSQLTTPIDFLQKSGNRQQATGNSGKN
jgi:hypothetical protein